MKIESWDDLPIAIESLFLQVRIWKGYECERELDAFGCHFCDLESRFMYERIYYSWLQQDLGSDHPFTYETY